MARADRLFRLLSALRRLPQPATAARLAEETGVSPRTLYRDIEALRVGGALIDGAPGYGYTLTEDPALPPQMLRRIEVEALALGLAEIRLSGDPELAEAADSALAKIVATLPDRVQAQALHTAHQLYRFETRPPAPPHLAIVRAAIWEERALDIGYCDRDGAVTRRRIWPLSVVFLDRSLLCLAFCQLRQDFRRFHLRQMVEVATADESFRPRRAALLRQVLAEMRQRSR
ncbi:MAG: YafY family transcriptional regulator [Rhodobacteraceae bacterium]|jgi:predicted DNA-binding transcriptional regulator YafY|nr:YafY family transcriptional regulator [Paracoccaceae bacterium]